MIFFRRYRESGFAGINPVIFFTPAASVKKSGLFLPEADFVNILILFLYPWDTCCEFLIKNCTASVNTLAPAVAGRGFI
ncbi:MAG: hypothetical protein AVO34_02735 [Firmicutes bacterium ML8_F2]|nr:MAG: hypothetical protein AVO34_02735 [Firmicutes bacterium ML8_F2]